MTIEELLNSLEKWKKDHDPGGWKRSYKIKKIGNHENINILYDDQCEREFDYTIDNLGFIIFEDIQNNKDGCIMNRNKFANLLIETQPKEDK